MVRKFDIPLIYKGRIISRVKKAQQQTDPRKRDFSPTILDFGPVRFVLARHFGFCYGVENAVEIAYRTLAKHPDKRVFLLSEIIHNPRVNRDLEDRNVRFLFAPSGEQRVPWEELTADDIVIVPAFGTTLEMQQRLAARGIDPYEYDTTCPFVEKVWKRSAQLGDSNYTVVVHGKATHEETRATFSHSVRSAPTVVVLNFEEARVLADIIRGVRGVEVFETYFRHKSSAGFDPARHLRRVGVVNQTTMLASETRDIAQELRRALVDRFGAGDITEHFADTSDTLCYATNENQNSTYALIEHGADVALVVGGHNSSNTSHIVELCAEAMPTYFIQGADDIESAQRIRHFDLQNRSIETKDHWLLADRPVDIVLTCGASCPDAILDAVLVRVLSFFDGAVDIDKVLEHFPPVEQSG
jgi:4-hydroxy-3-methylbut-2-enyl diphosphate reductase